MATNTDCRHRLHTALGQIDALMSRPVYDALFDAVARETPDHILEIGTAHGAGTIAMALGAESRGAATRIQTVDTLEALADIPSSRADYGDAKANEDIVRGNFDRAGVASRISLFVGRSDVFAASQSPGDPMIGMLVLDADGRIDRDLLLFHARMTRNCLIVVDDIDGDVGASFTRGGLSLDLKHVISEKLTSSLVAHGYLKLEKRVWNTSFFRAVDPQDWDEDEIRALAIACYRELVFLKAGTRGLFVSTAASLLGSNAVLRPFYGSARAIYRRLSRRPRR
ncbi:class I SAM-dependent methyltransferase [Oceaniglobus indicus]|uniref:class I SAM-dependent methyltransferase n=1 Tax=Oceaniglobus indicus TaxID=2047749 RepID=UPI0013043560|nr:class I SAM-dependent methyltransferase [Oceaniglobus indicus]